MVESNWWIGKPAREVALAQLKQDRLCMPFDVFQETVAEALGEPVFTHQFAEPQVLIERIEKGTEATESPFHSLHRMMTDSKK